MHDFTVTAVNDKIDTVAGTRSFTLVVNHPGIIWTGTRVCLRNKYLILTYYSGRVRRARA